MNTVYPYPEDYDSHPYPAAPVEQDGNGARHLSDVLETTRDVPPYALLLGMCEDGLPLLLDLKRSNAGHFLLAADDYQHNASALHLALLTASLFSTPEQVVIRILTTDLKRYPALIQDEHLKACFSPEDPEAGVFIEELYRLAVARYRGRSPSQPIHILALDEFDILVETLNPDQRAQLQWLLDHSLRLGIWVFASLETAYFDRRLQPLINAFPARLVGAIDDRYLARLLAQADPQDLAGLHAGQEAFFYTRSQARYLWLPQTG